MQDFLKVSNINDLNSALSGQRALHRQALVELDHLTERCTPKDGDFEGRDLEIAAAFKSEEVKLIRRYAELPTLTEFQTQAGLKGLAKEGGTFGTAVLIGEIVLSIILGLEPQFARLHRYVLILLMKELDNAAPEEGDLVDTVLRFMRIELKESVKDLSEKEQYALLRGLVGPLVEAMIMAMQEYQLVESPDSQGFILTLLGKRVLLHLYDSEKFIETITSAHKRLQHEVNPT